MDHAFLRDIALETERLRIRRLCVEDTGALFDMMSDPETCADDGGYAPWKELNEAFRKVVAAFAAEPDRLAIVLKETGETVGTLHLMDPVSARAVPALELGCCLRSGYRRHGYATEAAAALIAFLHEQKGVPLITAGAFDFNVRSQHMLEKLGFEREGITRFDTDHPVHGMTDMINYIHYHP